MVVDPSLTLSNHLDRERINVETSVLSVSAVPAEKIFSPATMGVSPKNSSSHRLMGSNVLSGSSVMSATMSLAFCVKLDRRAVS